MSIEISNFIDGERAAAADGRTTDLIDPSTGEQYATAPLSGEADLDRAFNAAAKGFETWRDATPSERQRALLHIADAIEERADELIAIESQNTGKPMELTASDEIPPMCDQIRFFAGAARVLEGKSAGEYMEGHTSFIRRGCQILNVAFGGTLFGDLDEFPEGGADHPGAKWGEWRALVRQ